MRRKAKSRILYAKKEKTAKLRGQAKKELSTRLSADVNAIRAFGYKF